MQVHRTPVQINFSALAKRTFPAKTLFSRILLIIVVPIICSQIISTYMFYRRHWDLIGTSMISSLASEMALIVRAHKVLPRNAASLSLVSYEPVPECSLKQSKRSELDPEIAELRTELTAQLGTAAITIAYNPANRGVMACVTNEGASLLFSILRQRVYSSSTHVFILWMIGSTIVLSTLSILFARNQTRSIKNLSIAAKKLGSSKSFYFSPQGAEEVKVVGYALLRMKSSLEKQIKERTRMLAAISHDLKTPLTRMKIAIALEDQKSQSLQRIEADVNEMGQTISDYMLFAKEDGAFNPEIVDVSKLLLALKEKYGAEVIVGSSSIYAHTSTRLLNRILANVLDNAAKFGSMVRILLREQDDSVVIEVHDNGPGMSDEDLASVGEPFYRTQESIGRGVNGSGLGLTITHMLIEKIGGSLKLSRSELGGLAVRIKIKR